MTASQTDAERHSQISEQLAELRGELRSYVGRHDRQHDELCSQHDELRRELKSESAELEALVSVNTSWRLERQAWEKVGRFVIGSNVLVLVGLIALLARLIAGD